MSVIIVVLSGLETVFFMGDFVLKRVCVV